MTIFDHWWWLMIPGLLLGLYAQMKLSSAYTPLKFRMALVPVTQIATTAATWITFGGYIMGTAFLRPIIGVAIGVFAVITFFQLVTLPVEYDASRRAKDQLVRLGLVQPEERRGVSKVLDAAALTYVAAMFAPLFTLLLLLLIPPRIHRY